jgi:uncharacterized cupredoxin-like copper-binding protein
MRLSSDRRRLLTLCALVPACAIGFAASFVGSTAQASTIAGPLLRVTERDFRIKAPRSIEAGRVRLHVHNLGPDTHELLLVRVRSGYLPLRTDGLTVDEDKLEPLHPVNVEGMERGKSEEVRVVLAPGRYVLFCNMAGHYLSGMRATLVVR